MGVEVVCSKLGDDGKEGKKLDREEFEEIYIRYPAL